MKRLFAIIAMFAVVAFTGCKEDDPAIVDDVVEPPVDTSAIIEFSDENFQAALIESGFDLNRDGEISEDEALAVETINITGDAIVSLDGLDYFENLVVLQCSNTSLTEIAPFTNTKLAEFKCNGTDVSFVDVSACSELTTLYADSVSSIFITDDAQGEAMDVKARLGWSFVIGSDPYEFSDDNFRLALLDSKNGVDIDGDNIITNGEVRVATSIDISPSATSAVVKSEEGDEEVVATGLGNVINADFKDFIALQSLNCDDNPSLSFVDLSACPNLTEVKMNSVSMVLLSEEQSADETFKSAVAAAAPDALVVSVAEMPELQADIEAYMLLLYDTDGDSSISYGEAAAATTLNLYESSVTTAELQAALNILPSLKELGLFSCSLVTTIDLSTNGALQLFTLNSSDVHTVDLCANAKITYLNLKDTKIESVDLSVLTKLATLNISGSNITESLDLTNNTALTSLDIEGQDLVELKLSGVDVSVLTSALEQLSSTEASLQTLSAESLTVSGSVAESIGSVVVSAFDSLVTLNVPQAGSVVVSQYQNDNYVLQAAEGWVIGAASIVYDLTCVMTFSDGYFDEYIKSVVGKEDVTLADAAAVKEIIFTQSAYPSFSATSIPELIYFTSLETLSLDGLSSYTAPVSFSAAPFNTVTRLTISGTSVESLDPTTTLSLIELMCNVASITTLDVSTNLNLERLDAEYVTELTIAQSQESGEFISSWNLAEDVTYIVSSVDITTVLTIEDPYFSSFLMSTYDANGNKKLAVSEVITITDVDLSSYANVALIASISELEYFNALQTLNLTGATMTELDFSECTDDLVVTYPGNYVTSLTLSATQWKDGGVEAWMPLLILNGEAYIYVEGEVVFSLAEAAMTFEDSVFESLLLASALNTTDDGVITYGEAYAATSMSVSGAITSVAELFYFANLETISITSTSEEFTSIDLSSLAALSSLTLTCPSIAELSLTSNTALTSLTLSCPSLTTLSVSKNTLLEYVDLTGSAVSTLDVSSCAEAIEVVSARATSTITALTLSAAQQTAIEAENDGDLTGFGYTLSRGAEITVDGTVVWIDALASYDSASTITVTNLNTLGTAVADSSIQGVLDELYADTADATAATAIVISSGDMNLTDLAALTGFASIDLSGAVVLSDDETLTLPATLFKDNLTLTSFVFSSSFTAIEDSAFSGATSLASVTLSDALTTIGGSAFSGATSLASITIPETVITIGASAFSGATSLTTLEIPAAVETLGDSAFAGCSGIGTILVNWTASEGDLIASSEEIVSFGSSAFPNEFLSGTGAGYITTSVDLGEATEAEYYAGTALNIYNLGADSVVSMTSSAVITALQNAGITITDSGVMAGITATTLTEIAIVGDGSETTESLNTDLANLPALETISLTNSSVTELSVASNLSLKSLTAEGVTSLTVGDGQIEDLASEDLENAVFGFEYTLSPSANIYNSVGTLISGADFENLYFVQVTLVSPDIISASGLSADTNLGAILEVTSLTKASSTDSSDLINADLAYFTELTSLSLVSSTGITTLDLSNNLKLTTLNVTSSTLTEVVGLDQISTLSSLTFTSSSIQSIKLGPKNTTKIATFACITCYGLAVGGVDLTDCPAVISVLNLNNIKTANAPELKLSGATGLAQIKMNFSYPYDLDVSDCSDSFVLNQEFVPGTHSFTESITISEAQYEKDGPINNNQDVYSWYELLGSDAMLYVKNSYGSVVYEVDSSNNVQSNDIMFTTASVQSAIAAAGITISADGGIAPADASSLADITTLAVTDDDLDSEIFNAELVYFTGLTSLTVTSTSADFTTLDLSSNLSLTTLDAGYCTYLTEVIGLDQISTLSSLTLRNTAVNNITLGSLNTAVSSISCISCTGFTGGAIDLTGCTASISTLNLNNVTTDAMPIYILDGATGLAKIKMNKDYPYDLDISDCSNSFIFDTFGKTSSNGYITKSLTVNETQFATDTPVSGITGWYSILSGDDARLYVVDADKNIVATYNASGELVDELE